MSTYEAAVDLATKAHEGQKRWNGDPYITHPLNVAKFLKESGLDNETLLSVAILHDVIEDTKITEEDLIGAGFSSVVVEAVRDLTKTKEESYDEYLTKVSLNYYSTLVKQADLMDNLKDLKDSQRRDKYLAALLFLKTTVRFVEMATQMSQMVGAAKTQQPAKLITPPKKLIKP